MSSSWQLVGGERASAPSCTSLPWQETQDGRFHPDMKGIITMERAQARRERRGGSKGRNIDFVNYWFFKAG